jgi:hypothetical protein
MNKNVAQKCVCNKCERVANSAIAGKPHRRCGGEKGAKLRGPTTRLPNADKGEWEEYGQAVNSWYRPPETA